MLSSDYSGNWQNSDSPSDRGQGTRGQESEPEESHGSRSYSANYVNNSDMTEKRGNPFYKKGVARRNELDSGGAESCQIGRPAGKGLPSPLSLYPDQVNPKGELTDVPDELAELISLNSDQLWATAGKHSTIMDNSSFFGHGAGFHVRHTVKRTITLGENIVPVIDLRARFARHGTHNRTTARIAICDLGGKVTGVILGIEWDSLRQTDPSADLPRNLETFLSNGHVQGITRLGSRLLVWLDDAPTEATTKDTKQGSL
ncbi:MAG: chemotaxis protein CheW [candidate division Zixibacteria bacterium]|nr:chemotaxis protein CheW [candidate division Zixibacteria bacterium]